MQELTKRQEKELRNAYFSAIKVTGEGYNGEYFRGNYPNIEECFKESYIEWLNEFKFELDYSIEEIKKINNEINKIFMENFYCQRMCGEVDFSISEWNEAFDYCNKAGIEGIERDKILNPDKFPCTTQCFDCCAIVGETRIKTQKLIKLKKLLTDKINNL